MKIRIKFRKWGVMKFVGHLDIMRYFQKAMRRASIDISYTAGYSPHQIMSFASPLGLGLTSDGEYLDMVNSTMSSRQAVDALNAVMADGVEVVSYVLLPDSAKNAMSLVAAADYLVSFDKAASLPPLEETAARFLSAEAIPYVKKTKKNELELDLKPMIHKLRVQDGGLFMRLAAGSAANIKPVQVLEAMSPLCPQLRALLEEKPHLIQVHRLELYADKRDAGSLDPFFVPLEKLGEEIV